MPPNDDRTFSTINSNDHFVEKKLPAAITFNEDLQPLANTPFQHSQHHHAQSSMCSRSWLLLSLPMAAAIIVSASTYYLSTITSNSAPSLHRDHLLHSGPYYFSPDSSVATQRPFQPQKTSFSWSSALFGNRVSLSSSSWPLIPAHDSTVKNADLSLHNPGQPCPFDQEAVSVVKDIHDDEYEEEDDEDDDDDGDDDDDDDDDEVEEEEEEECSEWDAIMHIPGGETARVGSTNDAEKTPHFIQEMEHQMLATVSQGMESENGVVLDLSRSYSDVMLDMSNSGDSTDWSDDITILNLSHRNHRNYRDKEEKEEKKNKKKSHISIAAGDELGSEEGEGIESDDEDEHDHFPSNIKHNNDASEGEEEKDGHNHSHHKNKDKQDDDQDNGGHHHRKPNHGHHSQDQNANLGSTGANGPILLCSSRSCLPSLRDSILSKLSVQIHLVMNHLRHRGTLFHGMEDTAPQTKESLIATQEEMVQQLEDRIVKDLRDWVMGVNRKSSSASETKDKKLEVKTALAEDDSENYTVAEMSVESEGLFLGGEDFETEGVISAASSSNGFRMASLSLSLKDADDDDEGHQDAPAAPQKKSKKSRHHERRDDEHGQRQSDSFLTADKVLMREEWSRWIAHWVHHAKLLILSHSLATRTLQDMNQIAISGENVVSTDQRHWSWNLDKALATVMVATEMLCGGPAPMTLLASTRRASAPKVMASSDDAATLKALALTLNAQKCVDVWSPELEIILQHTATKA